MTLHPDLGYFDEGLDLLEPKLYAAAQKPFGRAESLPPPAFRSKIFADLEDEKIWTRTWVCIGTKQQIPDTGDLLPFTLGNHGIHVQRMADGGLVGRFNKAQHGGCRSIPLQCQTGMKTKCSFTSCGYSRDQAVIHATEMSEGSQLAGQYLGDRPERLFPVHVESWGPFIFANVDRECAPLAKQFTGLNKNLSPYFASDLKQVAERRLEHGSNWKLVGRAFLEDLALPFTGEPAAKTAAKGVPSHAGRLSTLDDVYDGRFENLPPLAGIPKVAQRRAGLYWLFPNLLLALMPDHVLSVILQPTATCLTLQRVILFTHESMMAKPAISDLAELNALWDTALHGSAQSAEARQDDIDSWGAKRPPKEDSAHGYAFQKFLVERILTEHEYYWPAPLFAQPGR